MLPKIYTASKTSTTSVDSTIHARILFHGNHFIVFIFVLYPSHSVLTLAFMGSSSGCHIKKNILCATSNVAIVQHCSTSVFWYPGKKSHNCVRLFKEAVEKGKVKREVWSALRGHHVYSWQGDTFDTHVADGQTVYRRWDAAPYGGEMTSIVCNRSWEV